MNGFLVGTTRIFSERCTIDSSIGVNCKTITSLERLLEIFNFEQFVSEKETIKLHPNQQSLFEQCVWRSFVAFALPADSLRQRSVG